MAYLYVTTAWRHITHLFYCASSYDGPVARNSLRYSFEKRWTFFALRDFLRNTFSLVHILYLKTCNRHQATSYVRARGGSCLLVPRQNNCCHQMSDFMAKMHQIRFRLGLRPRPRWGSLQRSPDPVFKGPTSKRREGRGRSTCLPPRFDNTCYGPESYPAFCDTIGRWIDARPTAR